jgi:16S rRNA (guanine527-N7)-methyltransferase
MDIGSGGGSPAIPLKLSAPAASLTMVEVKARKSAFLREAIRTLRLERSSVETARYELLARPELHEAVDMLRFGREASKFEPCLRCRFAAGGYLFCSGPGGPDSRMWFLRSGRQPHFAH